MNNKKLNVFVLGFIGFLFTSTMFINCSSQFNSQSGMPATESTQYNLANEFDLVRLTQKPESLTNVVNETVRYEVISAKQDLIEQIQFKLNAEDWKEAQNGEILLANLAGGNHKISVRAKGKNGSLSVPIEHAWFIDNVRPDIVVNMAPTAPVNVGNNVEIIYSVVDSQPLTLSCRLDGVAQLSCASPLQFSNLVTGAHSLEIHAIDAAGNEKTEQINFSIVLPVSNVLQNLSLSAKPEALSYYSAAQFAFSSSGMGSPLVTFKCKLDLQPESPCLSGVIFSGLSDGDHEVVVVGYDSEGNASAPVAYQWRIDTVAPTITFLNPAGSTKTTTDLNDDYSAAVDLAGLQSSNGDHIEQFNFADNANGSGIEEVQCQLLKYRFKKKVCDPAQLPSAQDYINCLDNQYYLGAFEIIKGYFTCTSPVDLRDHKGGGVYRLKVKVTDKAGNVKLLANEYRRTEGMVAYGSLNLQGGAALVANVIPLDQSKQLLQTYDRMGMGKTSNFLTTMEFGALWYQESQILAGLRQILNAADYSKVKVFAISNRSEVDTLSNKFLAHGIIEKLGRSGNFFPVIIGYGENLAQSNAIVAPSAYKGLSQSNQVAARFGITQLNAPNDLNILSSPEIAQVWGVNGNSSFNSSDMLKGTATLAVLKDYVGTLDFALYGYDYRNGTRVSGDHADLQAGILIGKVLKTALILNKNFVLNVSTDGSIRSPQSDIPGGPWVANHTDGIQLFFVVDVADRFNFGQYMIGSFKTNQLNGMAQEVDEANSVAGTDPEKVAAIIACNYAILSGITDCAKAINNKLTSIEIQQTTVITPK